MKKMQDELENKMQDRVIAEPVNRYGFVSVAPGEGVCGVFRDLGVDNVVEGGQTMNPSTEDILKEILRTPAEIVYVLPNNKNIIMAAQQCEGMAEGKQVVVLPTRTVPQGISALLVLDPDLEEGENTAAMQEAADRVSTSEVTYAARSTEFDGFQIREGDYMALTEGQLFGTESELNALLERLAQAREQQEAEFINLFYGEDVSQEQAEQALAIFQKHCPDAEVNLLSGGQPVYYYMISAE
jgi:dihydroxyacetone kinase-like predicted kinase